jgi:flagellar basal body-associated protein FliL
MINGRGLKPSVSLPTQLAPGWSGRQWRPIGRLNAVLVCAWLCLAASGCGSEPAFEFDELDLVAAEEELEEFSLGEYAIPIPATGNDVDGQAPKRNRVQMDFELFALVSPHEKSKLSAVWERHEGMIRDHVIRICRNSPLEVLHEPELGTLKAKLKDALGPHFGDDVHQLLITDVVTREI